MAYTLANSNADNSWIPNAHSRTANYYKKNMRCCAFIGNVLLLFLLLCVTACRDATSTPIKQTPIAQTTGAFKEYPLPQTQSGLMRPAVDHQGRIWFGEMEKNYLASFDPQSKKFVQITPPHGQYGIMGVIVAPDDTVWFAEQIADYIGHYDPKSKHFTTYALPQVSTPDPANKQHRLSLPSAPNELISDQQGDIWFTEMNADAIGKLQVKTGTITQYPLTSPPTVQKLSPYSITADAQGNIWFTASGESKIGRITPHNGAIHFYSIPKTVQNSDISLMEIIDDPAGMLWITTFNTSNIIRFDPSKGAFTTYQLSNTQQGINGVYGIIAASGNYLWATVAASNAIVRFDTTTKKSTNYTIPTARCTPLGIVMAPDHTLWFTESATDQLGMFKP
jgi:virginiamycin B lyase